MLRRLFPAILIVLCVTSYSEAQSIHQDDIGHLTAFLDAINANWQFWSPSLTGISGCLNSRVQCTAFRKLKVIDVRGESGLFGNFGQAFNTHLNCFSCLGGFSGKKLEAVRVDDTGVYGQLPFSVMPSLHTLTASNTGVSGGVPAYVYQGQLEQVFDVRGTSVGGYVPELVLDINLPTTCLIDVGALCCPIGEAWQYVCGQTQCTCGAGVCPACNETAGLTQFPTASPTPPTSQPTKSPVGTAPPTPSPTADPLQFCPGGWLCQWALALIDYSSSYASDPYANYGVGRILGEADVVDSSGELDYGSDTDAWSPATASAGNEFVVVNFTLPVLLHQVAVYENVYPGAVSRLDVLPYGESEFITVFLRNATATAEVYTRFPIDLVDYKSENEWAIGTPTAFETNTVRVWLATDLVSGWQEIDAIQLRGVYVPKCDDGLFNGDETDLDCGGPQCVPCADQRGCEVASDCVSNSCNPPPAQGLGEPIVPPRGASGCCTSCPDPTEAPTMAPTPAPALAFLAEMDCPEPSFNCTGNELQCQYACTLADCSTTYGSRTSFSSSWGCPRVLGPHDCVFPGSYSSCSNAWSPRNTVEINYIEVLFPVPMFVERVLVWEAYGTGALFRIDAFSDDTLQWTTVYNGTTEAAPDERRVNEVQLDFVSPLSRHFKFFLDASHKGNEDNEIDALLFAGTPATPFPTVAPSPPTPMPPVPPPDYYPECSPHVPFNFATFWTLAPSELADWEADNDGASLVASTYELGTDGRTRMTAAYAHTAVFATQYRVTLLGGCTDWQFCSPTFDFELFDPRNGLSTVNMHAGHKRVEGIMAATDSTGASRNRLLVAGGDEYGGGFPDTMEVFSLELNQWAEIPATDRRHNLCVVFDRVHERMLIAGGRRETSWGTGLMSDLIEYVDMTQELGALGVFALQQTLAEARMELSCVEAGVARNVLVFAGGIVDTDTGYNTSDVVDVYDAVANQWSVLHMPYPAARLSGAALRDHVFWSGGGRHWRFEPDYEIVPATGYEYSACSSVLRLNVLTMQFDVMHDVLTHVPYQKDSIPPHRLVAAFGNRFVGFVGGYDDYYDDLEQPLFYNPVDVYDIEADRVYKNVMQAHARSSSTVSGVGEFLVIAGGSGKVDHCCLEQDMVSVLKYVAAPTTSAAPTTGAGVSSSGAEASGTNTATISTGTGADIGSSTTPTGAGTQTSGAASSADPDSSTPVATSNDGNGNTTPDVTTPDGGGATSDPVVGEPDLILGLEPAIGYAIFGVIGLLSCCLILLLVGLCVFAARRSRSRRAPVNDSLYMTARPRVSDTHRHSSTFRHSRRSGLTGSSEHRRGARPASRQGSRRHLQAQANARASLSLAPMSTPIYNVVQDGGEAGTLTSMSAPSFVGIESKYMIAAADLDKEQKIGEGAFGVVFKGKWRNISVAIKEVKEAGLENEKELADFMDEAGKMQNLRPHANVVTFYGVCEKPLAIIAEFCPNGALDTWLRSERGAQASTDRLVTIIVDIARGVAHLHTEGVIHRDLAARNILLGADFTAKVSDFGMSRLSAGDDDVNETRTKVGPLKWMAPEQLLKQQYSKQSDVFAFGVTAYEVLTRGPPWPEESNAGAVYRVLNGDRLKLPSTTPDYLRALIGECWAEKAAARPDMNSVCERLDMCRGAYAMAPATLDIAKVEPLSDDDSDDNAAHKPVGSGAAGADGEAFRRGTQSSRGAYDEPGLLAGGDSSAGDLKAAVGAATTVAASSDAAYDEPFAENATNAGATPKPQYMEVPTTVPSSDANAYEEPVVADAAGGTKRLSHRKSRKSAAYEEP